jgi:hypothetical protein
MLNYHNGGAYPTFEILNGQISMTVLDSITLALQAGYKIDYVSYPRPSEAKKRQESKTVGDPLEDEISRGITK